MDRIDQLENRIKYLEEEIKKQEKMEYVRNLSQSLISYAPPAFKEELFNKYSNNLPKKYKHLDFRRAVKKAKNKNRAQKLDFWNKYKNNLAKTLGESFWDEYWYDLVIIIDKAIEFYESEVIRYLFEEGKYVDNGGRPQDINPETVIYLWEKYSNDPIYIHKNGRYKGQPKKEDIYSRIAEDINMPTATRTIRDIIISYLK